MSNLYKIYIVNKYATEQTFWLFLQQPVELQAQPGVYANSSAYLNIQSNALSTNYFGVPVQYVVGAGASNQAVGLNVQVVSNIQQNANLKQVWEASYPFRTAPTLINTGGSTGNASTIQIQTDSYNKASDEANGWYGNQSFGIQTQDGFIGMTWSPSPGQTVSISPTLTFYVATGSYNENTLASYTTVSTASQTVTTSNFDAANQCTVTYNADGTWSIAAGAPQSSAAMAELADPQVLLGQLVLSHMSQSLTAGTTQVDTVSAVRWGDGDANLTVRQLTALDPSTIRGEISVANALTAAFAFFIISSTTFKISYTSQDGLKVGFTYNGNKTLSQLQDILKMGAQALFSNNSQG